MKKIILLVIISVLTLTGFSESPTGNFYMGSDNEKHYCKKINLEKDSAVAILENDEKMVIPVSEIKMYRLNGVTFEKLPVYMNNQNTDTYAFMEFITTRAGLRLYKYSTREEISGKHRKTKKYYVFKGNQLWMEITDKNRSTQSDFFDVSL
jgi:hypothetical protein